MDCMSVVEIAGPDAIRVVTNATQQTAANVTQVPDIDVIQVVDDIRKGREKGKQDVMDKPNI
jgi:hypothetical protein